MKTLQDATEKICELKGDLLALDVVMAALSQAMAPEMRHAWLKSLDASSEFAATVLMNSAVPEITIDAYHREVTRWRRLLANHSRAAVGAAPVAVGLPSTAR